MVADDQPIDREGLASLLRSQPDFRVLAQAASGLEAAAACAQFHPDVLLVDTRMPGLDGVSVIARVRDASPGTAIVAIAEHGEGRCLALNPPDADTGWTPGDFSRCPFGTDCLQLAVAAGARGALRRSATPEDLFLAIRTVARGHSFYDSRVSARLLAGEEAGADSAFARQLSRRERDVARQVAAGHCNKEIAGVLGVTEDAVKKHVGHILAKLGLRDRLQLGIFLARNPLVTARRGRAAPPVSPDPVSTKVE